MEERINNILQKINEGIPSYEGDSLFDAGLLDSFLVIELVCELEKELDIDIDANDVIEENFKNAKAIIALAKKYVE